MPAVKKQTTTQNTPRAKTLSPADRKKAREEQLKIEQKREKKRLANLKWRHKRAERAQNGSATKSKRSEGGVRLVFPSWSERQQARAPQAQKVTQAQARAPRADTLAREMQEQQVTQAQLSATLRTLIATHDAQVLKELDAEQRARLVGIGEGLRIALSIAALLPE